MPRAKVKPIPRFFYQWTEPAPEFCSRAAGAWQIFDRQKASTLDPQLLADTNGHFPIAFCITRSEAIQITNALNKLDSASTSILETTNDTRPID